MTATASAPARMHLADSPATLAAAARTFLRYGSPRVLLAIAGASLAARVALGGFGWPDAALALGILALWPLQEWLIHVCILHWKPKRFLGRTWDFAVPCSHRAHHRDPWRLDLVFIPIHVFLYAPLALGALAWALLPSPRLALTGVAVYFALALHYEWVHFLVHTRYTPRSARYRRLWRNHRLHHCKSERYWYGVSMLSGDRVLRTAPDHRSVPLSPTCRDLGVSDDLGRGRGAAERP